MAIFRSRKDRDYTVISNGFLRDASLSLKGKGLLAYFLSKPDDWCFYTSEIVKFCRDGAASTSNGINELISLGYIKRVKSRGENGRFDGGYEYLVYEVPQKGVEGGTLPALENPPLDKPKVENQRLINTDNKLNTKDKVSTDISPLSTRENGDVYSFYGENGFGKVNKAACLILDGYVKKYSKDAVILAMVEAVKNNKYTLSYVEGILKNRGKGF